MPRTMFDGVAGRGLAENSVAESLKRMMRNESVERSPFRLACMNALLASIGSPDIDPEASRTKTTSRGVISASAGTAGGSINALKNPPRSSR